MRLSRVPILAAVVAFIGGAAVEALREREASQEREEASAIARSRAALTHDSETVHLPHGSVWPPTVGAALALMAFGVVSSYAFSFAGLGLLLIGLFGWVGELRRE